MKQAEIADILEKIANRINPETNKVDTSEKILESTIAIRALFNAASILKTTNILVPKKAEIIHFYRTTGKYGFLSNFSKYSFILEDKEWLTSEHYYQAKKFEGTPIEEEIRLAKTSANAAKIGRKKKVPLRDDWETIKDQVMYTALEAKFNQNQEIKNKLIETGDIEIIEHTKNDVYWGDGGDGSGKNVLGILLMKLRKAL